ncbi:13015_t:CDS:2 [Ambispora gerdemannii]|uniref:13015_t:CDS:1 n=1 Tax=Ambispora gerdemannii TaxID=144530 RepID=A0A9N9GXH0_9GLOM|nr:13015_t:CDS:2 [Ambispora gerdemannii]
MSVPSCGVLQYERTHKATVPICFEEERKYIFDFVIVLWDLRLGLCWRVFDTKLTSELSARDANYATEAQKLSFGQSAFHALTMLNDNFTKISSLEYNLAIALESINRLMTNLEVLRD